MKKRGQIWDTLIPWIIGIGILVLTLILYLILSEKGANAIEYFKNLIKFR